MSEDQIEGATADDGFASLEKALSESALGCVFLEEPNFLIELLLRVGDGTEDSLRKGGVSLGAGIAVNIYPLHYADQTPDDHLLAKHRHDCIKELYCRWCFYRELNPNLNEGWFRSREFDQYMDDINLMKMNYAIFLR